MTARGIRLRHPSEETLPSGGLHSQLGPSSSTLRFTPQTDFDGLNNILQIPLALPWFLTPSPAWSHEGNACRDAAAGVLNALLIFILGSRRGPAPGRLRRTGLVEPEQDVPISRGPAITRTEQYHRCPVLPLGSLAVTATSCSMNTRRSFSGCFVPARGRSGRRSDEHVARMRARMLRCDTGWSWPWALSSSPACLVLEAPSCFATKHRLPSRSSRRTTVVKRAVSA